MKLFCLLTSSLSYKDLYLNWKQTQVLIFSTKCTLINLVTKSVRGKMYHDVLYYRALVTQF